MIAATASNLAPTSHPLAGRRVLVAEDSPTTHEILKLLLTQRGHHVDIATDGEQALEAMRQNHYDVALLDFHLPKMDGLRVATIAKRELQGRDLPRLIAITADLPGLLAHTGDCENFDLVIPKPLDIYRIGQLLEEQAELRDQQQIEFSNRGPKLRLRPLGPAYLPPCASLSPSRASAMISCSGLRISIPGVFRLAPCRRAWGTRDLTRF